jgi:PAS domain S-box-containing protein
MGAFDPAKLYRTDETIAQLLEAAPEAMVLMSADGRIVRVNAQTEKLFGYSQEELVGQNLICCYRHVALNGAV